MSNHNVSHLMYEPPRPNAPDDETPSHTAKVSDVARITTSQSADTPTEGTREPKQRTSRSDEEKRAIVAEYDAAPHGEKASVLAKYGINYYAMISTWRSALAGGKFVSTRMTEASTPAQKIHQLSARQLKLRERKTTLTAQLEEVNTELRSVREQLKVAVTDMIGEDDDE